MLQSSEPGAEVFFVEDDGTVGGRLVPSDLELIYEEVRIQARDGTVISRTVRGEQTLEIWQRTAIPAFYLDASEPYLYHEEGSTTYLDDGTQKHVYRIRRQPNHTPAVKPVTPPGPPQVSDSVYRQWAEAAEHDVLQLTARLSGLPEYQPPPAPPRGMFPKSEELAAAQMRASALQNHAALFTTAAAHLQVDVEAAGGHLLEVFPEVGWVSLEIPQDRLEVVLNHDALYKLDSLNVPSQDCACPTPADPNCTSGSTHWLLGQGRRSNRMDADKFLNVGIDGFRTNNNRNYGIDRLLAGIVESGILENESLALRKANGDSRVYLIADCAQSPCDYPTPPDYDDDWEGLDDGVLHWFEASNVTHGTSVASSLAADFRLGQADGNSFGDPTYVDSPSDLNHCAQWENASTGMAPGAAVIFSNAYPGSISAYTRAYTVMRNNHVDVLNLSHDIGTGCSISSSNTHEDELENGYDDGITIVAASGNLGGGESCNLAAPADTPKVIAVASLDCSTIACQNNYQDCGYDYDHTATGGMNATINGTTYSGIIAGVDLIAPQMISNVTHAYNRAETPVDGPWEQIGGGPRWPVGWNHRCADNLMSTGSSIAAPHVTGLALLLKHWQLNWGNTMFNSPGRLQALLLVMADRWDPLYSSPRLTGVSKRSGFGRIKLRYLGNSNFAPSASNTFAIPFTSGSPNVANWVWPFKMPVGTNFVKCVMFEPEDMSAKSDISDLYLQVNLKSPDGSGLCSTREVVPKNWTVG